MTIGTLLPNNTFQNADGTIRSVQPDGAIESRPAGTAGTYEVATVNGLTITYNPQFQGVNHVYTYVFIPTVPNAPGMSAIGEAI